ncbi:MAG: hypothetical protein M3N52_13665 [Actinomycetota bacterium]|nr:hypothetical protein [Actinomycetota bacterium]
MGEVLWISLFAAAFAWLNADHGPAGHAAATATDAQLWAELHALEAVAGGGDRSARHHRRLPLVLTLTAGVATLMVALSDLVSSLAPDGWTDPTAVLR